MSLLYASPREHLDDIVLLAARIGARQRAAAEVMSEEAARNLAMLDLELAELGERIERRLELTRAAGRELPLDALRAAFQLTATEQRSLWLLLAVEVAPDVIGGVATPEVLDALVYGAPAVRDRFADELATDGRLFRYALVEWADGRDDRTGRFTRPLRVSARVVDLAMGRKTLALEVAAVGELIDRPDPGDDLLIDEAARRSIADALARHGTRGEGPVPLVLGPEGAGRHALVAAAAATLGARLLSIRCADLPPRISDLLAAIQREAILFRAVIVLRGVEHLVPEPDAGRLDRARMLDAAFAGYPGPVALISARGLTMALLPGRGTLPIELGIPDEFDRATLWRRAIPEADDLAEAAAARYWITGGVIQRAAAIAVARAAGRGGVATEEDVHVGVRAVVDDHLTTLGVRIDSTSTWQDLVLPGEIMDELVEMIARVRHRRQVLDEWGFGRKIGRGLGLPALFSGPPGTGKTMVAGLVARELGLDLYQIDLSRMVSKYVGETEKNLARVFDAAEAGHAILLFDEADALFAKRTEVKSSVDRYANLEVNYLLQRMESFTGITILTTNFDAAIDEAFRRRLAFRIAFQVPDHDERARLWRALIPANAPLDKDVDFGVLAARFTMTGGYIKNAALRGAYLAAAEGGQIAMRHLLRGATAEYASMGKVISHGGALGR